MIDMMSTVKRLSLDVRSTASRVARPRVARAIAVPLETSLAESSVHAYRGPLRAHWEAAEAKEVEVCGVAFIHRGLCLRWALPPTDPPVPDET